ncbi:MAG: MarP family serine protease [Chloroflexi bacterium]|nr:MarP family serine protease [Chloroflexota bacterium]
MNLLDAILIGMVVLAALSGYRAGAVPQLFAWLGVALFVVGAFLLLPLAQPALEDVDPLLRGVVVLGAFGVAFFLGQGVGGLVGNRLRDRLGRGVLGGLDQLAGAVVGAAEGILVIWLASGLITAVPHPELQRQARDSAVLRIVQTTLPSSAVITARIERLLDESGLPRLFIGAAPSPAGNVPPPATARARAIAQVGLPSTVEVLSLGCGTGFVGSGFVVRPGYVVTNAHVVAGGRDISATVGADDSEATVVTFDADLDVALLHVPDLEAPALRLATRTPSVGTEAAALGHPGGRELTIVPAAVTASYPALGRNIYGEGTVTRTVIELRATLERGESGGPLVLPDGTVGGVIFGGAVANEGVGYALAPGDVSRRIATGLASTSAVSTGGCID